MNGATLAVGAACLAGFVSVVLGRNLTRSVFAAGVAIGCIGIALVASGGGYPAWFALAGAILALGLLQLFGWMLVDVDRDHLPRTDAMTAFARGLAFLLLAGGMAALAVALAGETPSLVAEGTRLVDPLVDRDAANAGATERFVGGRLFGPWREGMVLVGLLLAATLLASLMLLRGDGEGR